MAPIFILDATRLNKRIELICLGHYCVETGLHMRTIIEEQIVAYVHRCNAAKIRKVQNSSIFSVGGYCNKLK